MSEKHAKLTALQSPESMATVIHAIIRKQYGDDAYLWDPLTVSLEVHDDFQAEMDTSALDRWSAMQVVMTTDAFFKRLDAFLGICNTLSSGVPFFQVFDPVTVEEAAWAITEISLNRELLPFSYPVKKYLRIVLRADGYGEDDYPSPFHEVFDTRPDSGALRRELSALSNKDNVEAFIDEQLTDMVWQLNQIPDLKELDDIILRRSMDEYVGTVLGKTDRKE